jgi:hypothetical protein
MLTCFCGVRRRLNVSPGWQPINTSSHGDRRIAHHHIPQPVIESHQITSVMMIGEAVTNSLRVTLEIGPNGKKVVAVAPDWPGLARGATTEQAAIERLRSYIPRYAPVAELAGMEARLRPSPASTWSSAMWAPAQPTSGESRSRFRASTGKACRVTNWNAS